MMNLETRREVLILLPKNSAYQLKSLEEKLVIRNKIKTVIEYYLSKNLQPTMFIESTLVHQLLREGNYNKCMLDKVKYLTVTIESDRKTIVKKIDLTAVASMSREKPREVELRKAKELLRVSKVSIRGNTLDERYADYLSRSRKCMRLYMERRSCFIVHELYVNNQEVSVNNTEVGNGKLIRRDFIRNSETKTTLGGIVQHSDEVEQVIEWYAKGGNIYG